MVEQLRPDLLFHPCVGLFMWLPAALADNNCLRPILTLTELVPVLEPATLDGSVTQMSEQVESFTSESGA